MSDLRDLAYQVDPVPWVREVQKMNPTSWQQTFLLTGNLRGGHE